MDRPQGNQTFFLNLDETAHELRSSPRTILRALEEGKIRGQKVRGRWLFSRRAVFAYGLGFGTRLTPLDKRLLEELLGSI
jgi:excisionase family DNA binding protein